MRAFDRAETPLGGRSSPRAAPFSSPELSRASSSQLRALDEFIESPDGERWKCLVDSFRHDKRLLFRRELREKTNEVLNAGGPRQKCMAVRKGKGDNRPSRKDGGGISNETNKRLDSCAGGFETTKQTASLACGAKKSNGRSVSTTIDDAQMNAVPPKEETEDEAETQRNAPYQRRKNLARNALGMTARTPQFDESRDDRSTDREGHIICAREDSASENKPANGYAHLKGVASGSETPEVLDLDDVFEGLRLFKEENGHLLVPASHPSVRRFAEKLSPLEIDPVAGSGGDLYSRAGAQGRGARHERSGSRRTKAPGVPNGDDDAPSEDRARDDESVRNGERTPPPPPPPMILCGDGDGEADADVDVKSSKGNTVWAGAVRLVSGIDGVVPRRILYGASVTALVLLQVSFIVDHVMGQRISNKSHGVA